jgi:hypothetical protein
MIGGGANRCSMAWLLGSLKVAGSTQQDLTRVLDFACHDGSADFEPGKRVFGGPELSQPKEDVSRSGALNSSPEPASTVKKNERAPFSGALHHKGVARRYAAEHHNAAQMMKWDSHKPTIFVFHHDLLIF